MSATYLLIDGENIDATLGVNILKRFPRGDERPRWDRVLQFNPWKSAVTEPETYVAGENEEPKPATPTPLEAVPHPTPHPTPRPMPRPIPRPGMFPTVTESKPLTEPVEKPEPAENQTLEDETRGLFFLNASQRTAMAFVQALLAIGWNPVLLASENPEVKVVDTGIQKTLDAIVKDRPNADVVLASHDVDYLPQIENLLNAGHRVAIICFREYLAMPLAELEEKGLKILDIEYDVQAFNVPLSRVSPIDIDEYDPYLYI